MSTQLISKHKKLLYKALLALESAQDCEQFLQDLCTPSELDSMAERLNVAVLVAEEIPYRQIQQQTFVSTATVTRVARSLKYGSGGYRTIHNRIMGKSQ